jgi:heme exporter protein A
MSAIELAVEGLSANYGARRVLSNISFSLTAGEVLVVSGHNGSGKSTLLRLLCGLQSPAAGSIHYRSGLANYPPSAARQLFGWVAPDLMLYRELSARENLRFFADLRQLRRDDAQLDALLAEVGLAGRGDDRVAAYSSGMQQRLRYAYALLHEPPVLLLDEPTVTLDEHGAAVVDQIIAAQRQHGIVVVATNDPRELRYADLLLELRMQN